jgi:hypothetical protein
VHEMVRLAMAVAARHRAAQRGHPAPMLRTALALRRGCHPSQDARGRGIDRRRHAD